MENTRRNQGENKIKPEIFTCYWLFGCCCWLPVLGRKGRFEEVEVEAEQTDEEARQTDEESGHFTGNDYGDEMKKQTKIATVGWRAPKGKAIDRDQ